MIEDTRPIYTWNNRTFRSKQDLYAAVIRSWKKGVLKDPMNKYAFSTRNTLKVKSSYLDRLLGKKEKIIDNYIDRDKAQALINKSDAQEFLDRAQKGKSGLEPISIEPAKKKAKDTISRSDDVLTNPDNDSARRFYSGVADEDVKKTRINTALGVGATVGAAALAKKLLSKKKSLPKEKILNKINPYAAGAAGLGTVGLGTLYMNKTAENQEYEPDEVPGIDPKEEVYEEKMQEKFSVKRNPLKKKVKKKLKKEPIPKKEDLEFKNDLDDDPEDKMSEKVSAVNFYTSIINQTEKTAGRARKIRKLNKQLSELLENDRALDMEVGHASSKAGGLRNKIKEKDTFFGRIFNSSEIDRLKQDQIKAEIAIMRAQQKRRDQSAINNKARDAINTRLQMFRQGDEVGKSFRKSRDLYDSAAKEIGDTYGSSLRRPRSPRNIPELKKKNKGSLRTYEGLSRKLDSRTGMAIPMHPKRLDKIESRVRSSVGETNKLLTEGKNLRKKLNQQKQLLHNPKKSSTI